MMILYLAVEEEKRPVRSASPRRYCVRSQRYTPGSRWCKSKTSVWSLDGSLSDRVSKGSIMSSRRKFGTKDGSVSQEKSGGSFRMRSVSSRGRRGMYEIW